MSANWSKFLQVVAVLMVVSGVLLWSDLHRRTTTPTIVVKTVRDTLVIHDTITAYKPVPFNVYVVDTMWVPVTVSKTDTVWAQLPSTAKVYQDSTYRAVVSGPSIGQYGPSLDTISVYQRTKVITVPSCCSSLTSSPSVRVKATSVPRVIMIASPRTDQLPDVVLPSVFTASTVPSAFRVMVALAFRAAAS